MKAFWIANGFLSMALIGVGCSHPANPAEREDSHATAQSSAAQSPCPFPSPVFEKPSQAEQIDKTWSIKYEFEPKSIDRKHKGIRGYEITASYPEIARARTPATRAFNRWIRKKVRGYVAQFTRLERANENHDKRKGLPPIHISESLSIDYRMYFADNHLISFRLTHSVMALGQMHPIDYYETLNFDLRKHRALQPGDVFKRGYPRAFATYSRKHLAEKYHFDYPFASVLEGTRPIKSNFNNWNIVPDGILVSFEDYQIGPHTFGQAELIIPFRELRQVLRTDSIARHFVKHSERKKTS